ncbi:MAG: DUF1538 family protein [Rhodospirillales bacterium]|nr:DUF1538 family protein [Rhodospirillales bacterium]
MSTLKIKICRVGTIMGLFPIGGAKATAMARKGSLVGLLTFAFMLGFGTTVAEPALIVIAVEAAGIAGQAGTIENTEEAEASYALGLRMTVAVSVGAALVVGVFEF